MEALYASGRWGEPPPYQSLSFPAGERSKTRETWLRLTDALLDRGFGRDSGLIALGGGVTGHLAGFVAATYMRGVPYLQVPTTLVAMADASVGGKTGVDTPAGKNLVGAFHPPAAVLADPVVLGTLPDAVFREGLAETVKHGLIADLDYFEWMERHIPEIGRRDPEALTHLVRRSVEIKAAVVEEDEREQGRRAILNAGHTVAHALERESRYELTHGPAVALGLLAECQIAEDLDIAAPGLRQRVARLLADLGLPTRSTRGFDAAAVMAAMHQDKKNRDGETRMALPLTIGEMHHTGGWTTPVRDDVIGAALAVLR